MGHADIEAILAKYPLVSEQVSRDQLRVVLTELDQALADNPTGDIVEFGCYIGTTSLFIRRLLDARAEHRQFHVYDSFEGLPDKSSQDDSPAGIQFAAGELAVSKKQFLLEFQKAGLQPPSVHKGWFSDLTPHDVPAQICFAFLDGDFYTSIRDSLRLVLPRLTAHATIIIDDFAREALPGAARAVHEYAPQLAATAEVRHNMGVIHL